MNSFAQLEPKVVEAAREGEIHLYMDIKPEYPDTPRKWEHRLEKVFYDAESPASMSATPKRELARSSRPTDGESGWTKSPMTAVSHCCG